MRHVPVRAGEASARLPRSGRCFTERLDPPSQGNSAVRASIAVTMPDAITPVRS
jgi:hypothetical protein